MPIRAPTPEEIEQVHAAIAAEPGIMLFGLYRRLELPRRTVRKALQALVVAGRAGHPPGRLAWEVTAKPSRRRRASRT